MTDAPHTTPPDDPRRVLLPDLDRAQVTQWVERVPRGRWHPLASPEDRATSSHHVCALLVSGEWVRVMWPRSGGGGVVGHRGGGGRPPGRKNSKPRADKGVPRTPRK